MKIFDDTTEDCRVFFLKAFERYRTFDIDWKRYGMYDDVYCEIGNVRLRCR